MGSAIMLYYATTLKKIMIMIIIIITITMIIIISNVNILCVNNIIN